MINKRQKTVVILGNGFDLDLGLNTSYKDFWASKYCPKEYPAPLISFLNQRWPEDYEKIRWYDLENAFYDYAKKRSDNSENYDLITEEERLFIQKVKNIGISWAIQWKPDIANSLFNKGLLIESPHSLPKYSIPYIDDLLLSPEERDLNAFKKIKTGLCKYIDALPNFEKEKSTIAYHVLAAMIGYATKGNDVSVYTFNYTEIKRNGYPVHEVLIQYVHGDCKKGKIIIGTKDDLTISKNYDFVIKSYDPSFSPPAIVTDLQIAKEVIIFGHSIGENDRQYFESFFKNQSEGNNTSRKSIIIFTRDNHSELEIKRSLQIMTGGRLASLYSKNEITIIKTDPIEHPSDGERKDEKDFYVFLINHGIPDYIASERIGEIQEANSLSQS